MYLAGNNIYLEHSKLKVRYIQAYSSGLNFRTDEGTTRLVIEDDGDVVISEDLTVNGEAYCSLGYWSGSDIKIKEDIKSINNALEKVLKVNGVTYNLKPEMLKSSSISKEKMYGLIAQELKETFPELVNQDDSTGFYSVNYDGMIPILTEAMKEQQTFIDEQESRIVSLETEISQLREVIGHLDINQNINNNLLENNNPILFQNNPNPFNKRTEINYYLPESIKQASILILDLNGKQIKHFILTYTGTNKVVIEGGELTPGMYIYSLIADNKEVDTKRILLIE